MLRGELYQKFGQGASKAGFAKKIALNIFLIVQG
jgi:hypothetical protein